MSELGPRICGVVCPNATPTGDPVACAFQPLHDGVHSWASLPTFVAMNSELAVAAVVPLASATIPLRMTTSSPPSPSPPAFSAAPSPPAFSAGTDLTGPCVHAGMAFSCDTPWRAPDERGPWRVCAWDGSIHPEDLLALRDAQLIERVHMADWKYGWPHKAYVDTKLGRAKFYLAHQLDVDDEQRLQLARMTGYMVWPTEDRQSVRWRRLRDDEY